LFIGYLLIAVRTMSTELAYFRAALPKGQTVMKMLSSLAVAALIAASLPALAQQQPSQKRDMVRPQPKAVGGPLKPIYRVSGVLNTSGAASTGVATTFHCTNTGAVAETIRVTVRDYDGKIVGTPQTRTLSPSSTETMSTHQTSIFYDPNSLAEGITVNQGSAYIVATSNKIICSAMIVDAAASVPQGVALHLVRYDPFPGSQE
jgi:hypothetical protein